MLNDVMYGKIYLSDFYEKIYHTPEAKRMEKISQDSLPYWLVPWKVPHRLDHCTGVLCLASIVMQKNIFDNRTTKLLLASALLHDFGNAALSHLSEPFLKKVTGMDGESFLAEQLAGTQTEAILREQGIELAEVVNFVIGKAEPLSLVLHGSMDIDNLDNVGRYWFVASNGEKLFDAVKIAESFRFQQGQWVLLNHCMYEARKWQEAREAVYSTIYGAPHLNIVMMIWRALDLAYRQDELKKDFFHLSDTQAIVYLLGCNSNSAKLVQKVLSQERYTEAFCMEMQKPTVRIERLLKDPDCRGKIADEICELFGLPAWAVCAYVGKGSDRRKIELPFIDRRGEEVVFKQDNYDSPCRIKVYIAREFENKLPVIRRFVRGLV